MQIFREIYRYFAQAFIWWVVVAPWEQVVRVRLGKHIVVFGAGVHLRVPYIDEIYRQSVRRRVVGTPAQTISTKDGVTLTIAGQMSYYIENLSLLYTTLHHAEDYIQSEALSKISQYVVTNNIGECTPDKITEHVSSTIDLTEHGISGIRFILTNFASVRTYRLISGEIHHWTNGDTLNTNNVERVGEQSY